MLCGLIKILNETVINFGNNAFITIGIGCLLPCCEVNPDAHSAEITFILGYPREIKATLLDGRCCICAVIQSHICESFQLESLRLASARRTRAKTKRETNDNPTSMGFYQEILPSCG